MTNMANVELIVQKVLAELQKKTETGINVPVGVSARHIHLSRGHVEVLFGEGYKLTKKQELMGGQYAAKEAVTIVGPGLRAIENVRVLGPERKQTQVEISVTDAIRLGISPPLRESGDLAGSGPITVAGPKGAVYLKEGCIIPARHIHMPPKEASRFGLKDGDIVSIKTGGERTLIFGNVKIRIDLSFTLEMHMDTDEANACGTKTGDIVKIVTTLNTNH